jgi:hypothetical protein
MSDPVYTFDYKGYHCQVFSTPEGFIYTTTTVSIEADPEKSLSLACDELRKCVDWLYGNATYKNPPKTLYVSNTSQTLINDLIDLEPISTWFELSYAQYLTVPRLVMQSMPLKWQQKMSSLLQEMDETFDWRPKQGRYWVQLRDEHGHFSEDPLWNYRHGSIEHLRIPKEEE